MLGPGKRTKSETNGVLVRGGPVDVELGISSASSAVRPSRISKRSESDADVWMLNHSVKANDDGVVLNGQQLRSEEIPTRRKGLPVAVSTPSQIGQVLVDSLHEDYEKPGFGMRDPILGASMMTYDWARLNVLLYKAQQRQPVVTAGKLPEHVPPSKEAKQRYFRACLVFLNVFYQRILASRAFAMLSIWISLISDTLFCVLYILELVVAGANPDKLDNCENFTLPCNFYVNRPRSLWLCLVILSFVFGPAQYLYRNRTRSIGSWKSHLTVSFLLLLLCDIPLFASIFLQGSGGTFLYVPYFLHIMRAQMGAVRFSTELVEIGFLDPFEERIIALIGTFISIIFGAMCAFHAAESHFGNPPRDLAPVDALYFAVVTIATVGYGDVAPTSILSRITVMAIIIAAMLVLPSLITSTVETYQTVVKGGGIFKMTRTKHVVVIGSFEDPEVVRAMLEVLIWDRHHGELRVCLLARKSLNPQVSALVRSHRYAKRCTPLVGSPVNKEDLRRTRIEKAIACFVLADRGRPLDEHRVEDEFLVLTVWKIQAVAPEIPLHLSFLQSRTGLHFNDRPNLQTQLVVGIHKQALLGSATLHPGTSTLITNLLFSDRGRRLLASPWLAMYDDGLANLVLQDDVNPVFAGLSFAWASYYIFRQFQVLLFAVRTLVNVPGGKSLTHLILNPANHVVKPSDTFVFIGDPEFSAMERIRALSQTEYERSLHTFSPSELKHSQQRTDLVPEEKLDARSLQRPATFSGTSPPDLALMMATKGPVTGLNAPYYSPDPATWHIAEVPRPHSYSGKSGPLCHLLKEPVAKPEDATLEDALHLTDHVIIISGTWDVFFFLTTLRGAHLQSFEIKPVVILAPQQPDAREWNSLKVFPKVHIVIGEPHFRANMQRAGAATCSTVVILNAVKPPMQIDGEWVVGTEDAETLMIAEVAQYFCTKPHQQVLVELHRADSLTFLQGAPALQTTNAAHALSAFLASMTEKLDGNSGPESFRESFFTPTYAAGRAVVIPMLDTALFRAFQNDVLLDVIKLLSGVRFIQTVELDHACGVTGSYLRAIPLPRGFAGRSYLELFQHLTLEGKMLPLGLFRKPDGSGPNLGNDLPFVMTNPIGALKLRETDTVFVLRVMEPKIELDADADAHSEVDDLRKGEGEGEMVVAGATEPADIS